MSRLMYVGQQVVKVLTLEEAEQLDYRICSDAPVGTCSIETACALCSRQIFHAEGGPQRPMKICGGCIPAANEEIEKDGHEPDSIFYPIVLEEAIEMLRANGCQIAEVVPFRD